jgi:hypothetical protein
LYWIRERIFSAKSIKDLRDAIEASKYNIFQKFEGKEGRLFSPENFFNRRKPASEHNIALPKGASPETLLKTKAFENVETLMFSKSNNWEEFENKHGGAMIQGKPVRWLNSPVSRWRWVTEDIWTIAQNWPLLAGVLSSPPQPDELPPSPPPDWSRNASGLREVSLF